MRLFSLLCIGGLATLLAGCGGGLSNPITAAKTTTSPAAPGVGSAVNQRATGSAAFTIHWPKVGAARGSSRLIPAATQSIKIALMSGTTQIGTKTVTPTANASTSTVTFDNLTAGALHVVVGAFPTGDATGTAVAAGSVDVTITAGQVTNASLALASTIDHFTVSYAAPDLLAGETAPVTVTAYDANGSVVLLTPGALTWATSDAEKATVAGTSTGATLTGVGAGAATITVTDSESGVTKSFSVQGMTFGITPNAPAIPVGGTQTFTAAVAGLADNTVTYSLVDAQGAPVANDAGSGFIGANGHYTAPTTPGTYYARATSVGDPARFVTATLTIQAGNAAITVQ